MWIMLNDCFFSIVAKDCKPDELMVRARRPGDIEKVFADVTVTEFTASDYHYRAPIKRDEIKRRMCDEIDRVTYSNFKDSVDDRPLHNAYLRVWHAMATLQPNAPYSGRRRQSSFDFEDANRHGFYFEGRRGLSAFEEAHIHATGHMPDEDPIDLEPIGPGNARKSKPKKRRIKK